MRVSFTKLIGVCLVGGLALLMCPLSSSAITLDLTTGAPGGGPGNSFIVSNNGISATVSAFSSADIDLQNVVFANFLAAELNVTSQGVGICNPTEVLDCGGLRDAVNNIGFIREFVLIDFNSPVFLKEAIITSQVSGTVPETDSDVSFIVGSGATPDFLALTPGALGTVFDDPLNGVLPANSTRSIDLGSQVATEVDWLLLGASLTDPDPEDVLRVTSVSVGAVPEPSTLLLFGTGFAGLLLYNWRRKS